MTSVVDRSVLDRLCADVGDDPTVVRNVIAVYLEYLSERREQVATSLLSGDPSAVAKAAHAMTSASVTVGATALAKPARALETLATTGRLDGADELLAAIDAAVPLVRDQLEAW